MCFIIIKHGLDLIETNCVDVSAPPAIDACCTYKSMNDQERSEIRNGLMSKFIEKLKLVHVSKNGSS